MFGFKKKVLERFASVQQDIILNSESIQSLADMIEDANRKIKSLSDDVAELKGLRDKKDSNEPWFEFYGGEIHEEHGLQLQLDWNDAFIDQLRRHGYKGTSDDELVAQYIANIQRTIDERGKQ